jgi:hypothetical protein
MERIGLNSIRQLPDHGHDISSFDENINIIKKNTGTMLGTSEEDG